MQLSQNTRRLRAISKNLLVPEDLVKGGDDEHDCSVLGAWAARHRVLPRESPLFALIRLCCSTRCLLGTQVDPNVRRTWLGPATGAGSGAGGAGGLLDPHLHHFISPSTKMKEMQKVDFIERKSVCIS